MSKKLMTVNGVTDNTGGSSEASPTPVALIIDGTSLVYILDSELEEQVSICKPTWLSFSFLVLGDASYADVAYSF